MEEILRKYGQEHIIRILDKLNNEEKDRLEKQIKQIDFEQIIKLYNKDTKKEIQIEETHIEPIKYLEKSKLSSEKSEVLKSIGEKVLTSGRYAVVTMAGGQGTRLGHKGPKGTYKLQTVNGGKYLFEAIVDSLKLANYEYGNIIPWYIMTSRENNDATYAFLEENKYFGYPKENVKLFIQGELPLINTEGKLLLEKNKLIKEASDGNGGVYEAMHKNGVIQDMKKRGIEWVLIGGIDNVLLKVVDSIFIGYTISEKNVIASKSVVKKNPKEKAGVFCKKNGKPGIIEYIELPEEMASKTDENGNLIFGDVNIINHLFNINVLEDLSKLKLPYHKAFKKSEYIDENGKYVEPEEPNSYKFEAFIFDAFERYEEMSILRVKREDEFAPLKNANGVDSPETASKLYNDFINRNK